jgi:hypothetical protein
MRLEGHHGRFQSETVRSRGHVRQQRLVTAVDTVEVADRECAWRARPVVGKSAKYLHWMIRAPRRNTRLYGNPWETKKAPPAEQGGAFQRLLQKVGAQAAGLLIAMMK